MKIEKELKKIEGIDSTTPRSVLRTPVAEFSQSIYSTHALSDSLAFTAPRRDYSYEGLTAFSSNENWKFLDALFFALVKKSGGKGKNVDVVELLPKKVVLHPLSAHYVYEARERETDGGEGKEREERERKEKERRNLGELSVEYYLFSGKPVLATCFENKVKNSFLVIKPFVDIRHVYDSSKPFEHETRAERKTLIVSRQGKKVVLSTTATCLIQPEKKPVECVYVLGDGERILGEKREPKPRQDVRTVIDAGTIFLKPAKKVVVYARCAEEESSARTTKPKRLSVAQDFEKRFKELKKTIEDHAFFLNKARSFWGAEASRALTARLACLTRCFGTRYELGGIGFNEIILLEAGGYWFRNVWFRDAFEGLLTNFSIYVNSSKQFLLNTLQVASKLAGNESGCIPTKLPEGVGKQLVYNNADATLLYYLTAFKYFKHAGNAVKEKEWFNEVKASALNAVEFFSKVSKSIAVGENGLLKTPANYGWVDSVVGGVPTRIPREWLQEKPVNELNELLEKKFYLIEVNALWINFLNELQSVTASSKQRELLELLEKARENFKKVFCEKPRFPAHIASEELGASSQESAMAIEAIALLPDLFTESEVKEVLEVAEKTLFAYRNKKLFGLFLKNSGKKVFLNDEQYHENVVWLKETPYLLKLLARVKERKKIEEVLLNTLDHQQNEAAVFYSSELFSANDEASNEVIPVKNPVQFWSQWTQPFFDFLADEE